MQKIWTGISYNWKLAKTHAIVFVGPMSNLAAAGQFEEQHPAEDLVALVPGEHQHTLTFPLTKWSGREPEGS
jgi:hypothetical protein